MKCKYCEKEFGISKGGQLYCSYECKKKMKELKLLGNRLTRFTEKKNE